MTAEEDQARLIAERIARRVSGAQRIYSPAINSGTLDLGEKLAAMHASLDNLRQELSQLESRLVHDGGSQVRPPIKAESKRPLNWSTIGSPRSSGNAAYLNDVIVDHPSQERFGVEEATVSELVDFFEGDKKCEVEPGGKPCDHCAMCSSRGF